MAGPVETVVVRGRRVSIQRCLRCDGIVWTRRRAAAPYVLGDAVRLARVPCEYVDD